MPLTEFDLIRSYLTGLGYHRDDVLVGVGDDAACVRVPPGVSVSTIATSVRGAACDCTSGEAFGYVSFAHALLCALAARARPAWATLALTLPELRDAWVGGFSAAVDTLAKEHGVSVVGGDSTQGPLLASFFLSVLGETRDALHEHDAQPGDAVYVVGEIGCETSAPLTVGPVLESFASTATHIRRGLRDSVTRLTGPAPLGAALWRDRLAMAADSGKPADTRTLLDTPGFLTLCCLVAAEQRAGFEQALRERSVPCTHVGVVQRRPGIRTQKCGSVS